MNVIVTPGITKNSIITFSQMFRATLPDNGNGIILHIEEAKKNAFKEVELPSGG